MPLYERVSVPEKAAKDFAEWLKQHGGSYEGIRMLPDNSLELTEEELWTRQVAEARKLLAEFTGVHENPEISAGIETGLRSFVNDAFTHRSTKDFSSIPWEQVASVLSEVFDACLTNEPPEDIGFVKKPKTMYFTGSRYSPFLPESILLTLEKYGLADGRIKKYDDLSEKYGVSSTRARGHVTRTVAGSADYLSHLVSPIENEEIVFTHSPDTTY